MVVIDARMLGAEGSGIGRYTLNLLRAIDRVGPVERGEAGGRAVVVVWVSPAAVLPGEVARSGHLDVRVVVGDPRRPLEQAAARRRLRSLVSEGVRVLHCPDVFAPLWVPRGAAGAGGLATVVTLHDVIPLVCRGQLARSRKQRWLPLWRAWLKAQTRRAAAVVTVSEHSASDIHRELGVRREKLHVIPNAVPPPAPGTLTEPGAPPEVEASALRALGVMRPYLLYVGRRDPYKNVPGLVRAFAELRAKGQKTSGEQGALQLVIAGAADPRYPEAERLADELGVADAVRFTGWVCEDALAALYRRAAAVVLPSYYEGFGLPAVEAMRAGVPAVVADRASLPEVVGDAAVRFDPDVPGTMSAAIGRVLGDAALAATLVERGHRRAERYSLERFGGAHLRLYEQVAARRLEG